LTYVTGDPNYGAVVNLSSLAYTGFNTDTSTQIFGFDALTGNLVMFSSDDTYSGYGDGSSGYMFTGPNLSTILTLAYHSSAYNNAHMNIMYDQATSANMGYIAANYSGDSSGLLNYSILYDMSAMLGGYHKTATGTPMPIGKIGYGIPVKDVTATRYYTPPVTLVPYVPGNNLLVYPNPVVSSTRVVLPYPSEGWAHVDVIDMNSQVLASYKYEPRSYLLDVDISFLPVGIYFLRIWGKGVNNYTVKVQKGI
jgi:hypothetical protein